MSEPETMFERLKFALLPFLHHGLATNDTIEEEAARAVLRAMRQPTSELIVAGLHEGPNAGALVEAAYVPMIEAVLSKG